MSPEIELNCEYLEKYKSCKEKQEFNLYLKHSPEYQKKLSAIHKKVEKNRTKKLKHEIAMLQKWKVQELPCLWFPDYIIEPQSMYKDRPAVLN